MANMQLTLSTDELEEAVQQYLQRKGFKAKSVDFLAKIVYGGTQIQPKIQPKIDAEVVGCIVVGCLMM